MVPWRVDQVSEKESSKLAPLGIRRRACSGGEASVVPSVARQAKGR
jgi:hypothetical protein